MFPGDEITVRFKIVDNTEAETQIDISGATDVEMRIFEFIDDSAETKLLTGTVNTGVDALGQLEFTFAMADTSGLAPKTWIYHVMMTLSGDTIITHKSTLTIKNKIA